MISLFVIFVCEDSKELLCHLYGAIFSVLCAKKARGNSVPAAAYAKLPRASKPKNICEEGSLRC